MSYREYFNIDPEYFPQVDKKLIEEKPDLWKKFWPHPTFVQLLKAMVDVLERKQKLSMWVDGAYGTGKSHAVFTLKKLIEASDEETTAYFEKYGLDNFLCKKLLNQKNEGKILVCHRYGSSDIQSDTDLIVAMQEGIEKALAEAGIENTANTSLKNSLIRFFENEENRQSFLPNNRNLELAFEGTDLQFTAPKIAMTSSKDAPPCTSTFAFRPPLNRS